MSTLTIRLEQPSDYRTVELLTRDAFWGSDTPRCNEHLLVHLLRNSPGFIPQLDFVAECDGRIVGNIMFSRARIVAENGAENEVLTFGPLSVLPEFQGKGVGAALMQYSFAEAKRLGYGAIVIHGHPDYYPRVGFRRAAEFGITSADGSSFDAVMALELRDGALDGIRGAIHEDAVFHTLTDDALERFEATMPPKEPRVMVPMSVLLERLSPAAQAGIRSLNSELLWVLYQRSEDEVRRLAGIDDAAVAIIRTTLKENGYTWGKPPKDKDE